MKKILLVYIMETIKNLKIKDYNIKYTYSNKIFSNFFHITGVSKILMNVKQKAIIESLFRHMDERKYILSAENDLSEVAGVIGNVKYNCRILCTSDSINWHTTWLFIASQIMVRMDVTLITVDRVA